MRHGIKIITSLFFVLIIGLGLSLSCVVSRLGGASSHAPQELQEGLSEDAKKLVSAAMLGIDPSRRLDYHSHLVGTGSGGTGAWLNPEMRTWTKPIRYMRFKVYVDAAGIKDMAQADTQFVQRLVALAEHQDKPGRMQLLAFDYHYSPQGERIEHASEFHIPNDYVLRLAKQHPELFVPTASVNPYRKDAIAELERVVAAGAHIIKWLPNAMGIDPDDPALDPFYKRMQSLGAVLHTHAGEEKAVDAEEHQRYGNPLRLRRPLSHGVRVIVAHCASLGMGEDLDTPSAPDAPNLELFLRMMDEPRYDGLLYGEISALTQSNRLDGALGTMLNRTDLHDRLVNGSDYPLPAVNVVISTGGLLDGGFINEREREQLNEIYDYNPLLFDFVLKRTIRSPKDGHTFATSVFHEHPGLERLPN